MLKPKQKKQLDDNLKLMASNGATPQDIIDYAKAFRAKYDNNQSGTSGSQGTSGLPTWTNNYPCLLNSKLGKPVKTTSDNQVVINYNNGDNLYFWEKRCIYIYKNGEKYMGKWSCKDGKIYIIYDDGTVFDGDKIVSAKDVTKQPLKPESNSSQTPTPNSSQIPGELENVEGVKDFQDWLDDNVSNWATGYKGGKIRGGVANPGFKSGGYGRFGPRTQKAWSVHKDTYLKYLKEKGIGGTTSVKTDTTVNKQIVEPTPEVEGEEIIIDPNDNEYNDNEYN
jgi:hypothetical protein